MFADRDAMHHFPTLITDIQLIAAFAAHQQVRGFSRRTVDRRTWSLGLLAKASALATVTPDTLELFLARWPSAQSRYSIRSDVHQFYKWARRRGHFTFDPTDDVDPPRLPRRAPTPLRPGDLRRLVDEASRRHSPDLLRAVMLGAYAGLRCSEIAALDGDDVHHDQMIIVVRGGKGGSDDVIPMAPALAAVLPDRPGRLVRYPTGQQVGVAIRRTYRKLEINARPHDLRHSFGTAAARAAGGNMRLVQRLMRHASLTSTERYIRWNPQGAEIVAMLHHHVDDGVLEHAA